MKQRPAAVEKVFLAILHEIRAPSWINLIARYIKHPFLHLTLYGWTWTNSDLIRECGHAKCVTFHYPNEDINTRRDYILRCLSVYLNEDTSQRICGLKVERWSLIAQTTMGIYVIRAEGTGPEEEPSDVGVVLEVLQSLPSVVLGCVMLFGLIYALNLNYPMDLDCTFEAFQKIMMELDTTKLSPKVQGRK